MRLSQAVALLAGVGVPFVVDLITKSSAPRALKSFLAAALAALAGVFATTVYIDGADWKVYLRNVATAWVVALATHYTQVTNPVQRATADFGIGGTPTGQAGVAGPGLLLAAVILIVAVLLGLAVHPLFFLLLILLIVVVFL